MLDEMPDGEADVIRRLLARAGHEGTLWIAEEPEGDLPRLRRVGLLVRLPAPPVIQEEQGKYGVVS